MSKVVHFEFCTNNPERSIEFYTKVFGWDFKQFDNDYWLVTAGEKDQVGIEGAIMKVTADKAYTVNTIDVSSVDAYVKLVLESGGKVTSEKMEIPGVGYFAYCEDPTGLAFGIIEFTPRT